MRTAPLLRHHLSSTERARFIPSTHPPLHVGFNVSIEPPRAPPARFCCEALGRRPSRGLPPLRRIPSLSLSRCCRPRSLACGVSVAQHGVQLARSCGASGGQPRQPFAKHGGRRPRAAGGRLAPRGARERRAAVLQVRRRSVKDLGGHGPGGPALLRRGRGRPPHLSCSLQLPRPDAELLQELNDSGRGWLAQEDEQEWGLDDVAGETVRRRVMHGCNACKGGERCMVACAMHIARHPC